MIGPVLRSQQKWMSQIPSPTTPSAGAALDIMKARSIQIAQAEPLLPTKLVDKPEYLRPDPTQPDFIANEKTMDIEEELETKRQLIEYLLTLFSGTAIALIAGLVLRDSISQALEYAQNLLDASRRDGKLSSRRTSRWGDEDDNQHSKKRKIQTIEVPVNKLEAADIESLNGPDLPIKVDVETTEIEPVEKHTNDYSCYQTLGEDSDMMIFSGSANAELAREVCAHLSMTLGRMKVTRFFDGEVSLDVLDDVRSRDVYVFQSVPNASTGIPMHSHLMELFLAVSALRRASAERITAVLPYMAYSRQEDIDRKAPRPLAVADMARILYTLGVDRVVFVDLHAPRAAAFFPEPIPVTNLLPQSLAIRYLQKKNLRKPVVVATENTAGERAKSFYSRLKKEINDVGLATVVSNRPDRVRGTDEIQAAITTPSPFRKLEHKGHAFPSGTKKTYFVGDVNGRDCIIVDDIIDTGVRVSNAVRACKAAGARRVLVYASHGLLSQGAVDRLDKCGAEEVLLTNTIEIPPNVYSNKLKILNISKLLAEVLRRLHEEVASDFNLSGRLGDLYRDPAYDREQLNKAHSQ